MSNSYVIEYPNDEEVGGYGDRLVGLVTIFLFAKKHGKTFLIKDDTENTKDIICINQKYDYYTHDYPKNVDVTYRLINRENCVDFIKNELDKFDRNDNIIFRCNQELAQFMYSKFNLSEIYMRDIIDSYHKIYSEMFEFSSNTSNAVDTIIKKFDNHMKIGVQIRCGDYFLLSNNIKIEKKYKIRLKNIISSINEKILAMNIGSYKIFITSDFQYVTELARKICPAEIIYCEGIPHHLDKQKTSLNITDISKTFIDHYVLSKCDIMFISMNSNFGRTASLCSNTDKIYDIHNLEQIDIKKIPSKLGCIIYENNNKWIDILSK